ncbi:MAG: T9SS type A sorting domain-containing protein [Bacteroidales bacterium]|nr:T9SS type A sorting domain-containing protein [Bacteroidales bacterium]
MKTVIFLSLIMFAFTLCFSQNIYFSGSVDQGTVWDYDTVFLEGNVNIPEDIILEIAPGTKIIAEGYYRIEAYGCILALGNVQDTIVFTVADKTDFADTAQYEAGGWDGIHFLPSTCSDSSLFEYCKFSYGKAVKPDNNSGGAVLITNRNNIEFYNCTFEYNMCLEYGGAIYSNSTNLISYCKFVLNRTYEHGGAIAFKAENIEPIIANCEFIKNIAMNHEDDGSWLFRWGNGAGVYISTNNSPDSMPQVINNMFFANSYIAIYESCYNILIANNLIINNWYAYMNGMSIGNQKFINNTLSGNENTNLEINNPDLVIRNNIIYNVVGAWDFSPNNDTTIFWFPSNPTNLSYSNVQYNYFINYEGVISEDPQFVNSLPAPDPIVFPQYVLNIETTTIPVLNFELADFDYSLIDESTCINAGIPDTSLLNIPANDFLGNPRVYGGRIDMGAIENQYVIWDNIEPNSKQLSLYPNPAADWIFVQIEAYNVDIEITDINGRVLISDKLTSSVIDISHLPEGMYIVKLNTGKEIITEKFFKEGNN